MSREARSRALAIGLILALSIAAVIASWTPLGRGPTLPTQATPPNTPPEVPPESPPTPPVPPASPGEPGPPAANLTIRVRYANHGVVPWARVEVWRGMPGMVGSELLLNATNEDATYAIRLPLAMTYGVLAWGDGDPGFLGLREVRLTADTTFEFVDPTRPAPPPTGTATLSLHVRYADGTVVSWGQTEVWDGLPGAPGATLKARARNIDSTYSIKLPVPREYFILARGDADTGSLGQVIVNLTTDETIAVIDPTNPYLLSLRLEEYYYPWYGTPATDGQWIHWNEKSRDPPDDIASAFYPSLGPYSSADVETLKQHMMWIRETGAGVLVYSWWGPNTITDKRLALVLDQAARFGLRVAIHLEPGAYHTSPAAVIQAAADLKARFASKPAFLDRFHIFLATQFPLDQWRTALAASHPTTLLAQTTDPAWMDVFDGLCQYDGSVNLSTTAWASLAARARDLGKIFIPNVAPGYDESRAAGGKTYLTVNRENGARYDRLWSAALNAGADYVAVTTFNEWHEGTQIEPAQPKAIQGYTYNDYGALGSMYYIARTLYWTQAFVAARVTASPGG